MCFVFIKNISYSDEKSQISNKNRIPIKYLSFYSKFKWHSKTRHDKRFGIWLKISLGWLNWKVNFVDKVFYWYDGCSDIQIIRYLPHNIRTQKLSSDKQNSHSITWRELKLACKFACRDFLGRRWVLAWSKIPSSSGKEGFPQA